MKSRFLTILLSLLLAAHVSGLSEAVHLRLEHQGHCEPCHEDPADQTGLPQIQRHSVAAGGHVHDPGSCSVCRTLAALHGVGFVAGAGNRFDFRHLPAWRLPGRLAIHHLAFPSLPGEPRAPPVSMFPHI
jgi:hypothetical protein